MNPEKIKLARQYLQDAKEGNGQGCVVFLPHKDPDNGEECLGLMLINFNSWPEAVNSIFMRHRGYIAGICEICGLEGFINKEQELVQ